VAAAVVDAALSERIQCHAQVLRTYSIAMLVLGVLTALVGLVASTQETSGDAEFRPVIFWPCLGSAVVLVFLWALGRAVELLLRAKAVELRRL
jgi:hypothetical protein